MTQPTGGRPGEAGGCGAEGGLEVYEGMVEKRISVKAVVLAGVHAWGDCVLERAVTRPLLPVAQRPIIAHGLSWLRAAGVPAATICGNSESAMLRRSLGDGARFGVALDYYEDLMPRGPAGCARDAAVTSSADTFVVFDATIVPDFDLVELLNAHVASGAAVTLVASPAEALGQAPRPVGLYVFSRAALELVRPTGYQDIKEVLLPELHRKGSQVATYMIAPAAVKRVSHAASYLKVNMWAVQRQVERGGEHADAVRREEALVAHSARVDPTARLVGPVLIGPGAVIEAGALIVGPTSIGAGCVIGADAVVSRSAVWDGARVAAGAIVDQSVLTHGASVEPELVARETVCFPPRRAESRVLGRLASYCRAAYHKLDAGKDTTGRHGKLAPSRR